MRDILMSIDSKFYRHEINSTPCRIVFEPMLILLGICHDPVDYPTFREDVGWLLDENNGVLTIFSATCTPSWMVSQHIDGEVCLRFAKKLHEEDGDIDRSCLRIKRAVYAYKARRR
jgi:hypothetical protein